MTELAALRKQIVSLRRWRRLVREVAAYSALAATILWALAGVFLIDFAFFKLFSSSLDVAQRLVVELLAVAAAAAGYVCWSRPLATVRETDTDVVMLIENQHGIANDLVAALQFESAQAVSWGSPPLKNAVINKAAAIASRLDFFERFSVEPMLRRLTVFGLSALVLLGLCGFFPDHAAAFFNRLLLGSAHYPTTTSIQQVLVNGQIVLELQDDGLVPKSIKAAEGQPVEFIVRGSGGARSAGSVQIVSAKGDVARRSVVTLRRISSSQRLKNLEEALRSIEPKDEIFRGRLGALTEPLDYAIQLGDARTETAQLEMIPRPLVDLQLTTSTPAYARGAQPPETDSSARQIAVLEGSDVQLAIQCTNRKRLSRAWIVATADDRQQIELIPVDDAGRSWTLPESCPLLHSIRHPIRFEIQVIDEDQLSLVQPIEGSIRLRADRGPVGKLSVIGRVYLPSAQPVIDYTVNDDFGISRVALQIQIERTGGNERADSNEAIGAGQETSSSETSGGGTIGGAELGDGSGQHGEMPENEAATSLVTRLTQIMPGLDQPAGAEQLPIAGHYPLDLQPFDLSPGDMVKLTLEISDYRGALDGSVFLTEPVILEITDASGVLEVSSELDRRIEQQINEIKNRILN